MKDFERSSLHHFVLLLCCALHMYLLCKARKATIYAHTMLVQRRCKCTASAQQVHYAQDAQQVHYAQDAHPTVQRCIVLLHLFCTYGAAKRSETLLSIFCKNRQVMQQVERASYYHFSNYMVKGGKKMQFLSINRVSHRVVRKETKKK